MGGKVWFTLNITDQTTLVDFVYFVFATILLSVRVFRWFHYWPSDLTAIDERIETNDRNTREFMLTAIVLLVAKLFIQYGYLIW